MKILNSRYRNFKFTSFDLIFDNKTIGKEFEGILESGEIVLVSFYLNAISIGRGEDTYDARRNLEEVLELDEDGSEILDEKELFRILKWTKK